ncbi:MAG: acetolactate synthase [Opitutales bacterium]|nr:acetolactate synthase [Opitutales bacterium]|tara:strand:- start:1320 stop:1781 length:462 start_codon:yes stop_codon:yes gene_type:complete
MALSSIIQSSGTECVRQFAVYVENKVGRLNDVISSLRGHGVHIMALTTLETTDVTIVRIVPNYPADARKAFEQEGFTFVECPIVAVELNTEEDLPRVTSALLEAEINIHYLYPFLARPGGKSALAMRVEDMDVALETLSHRQIRILSLEDIAR